MRCKPASDKRFCYYRVSANEALTHLLFTPADNTEIGAHLFPALSADAIVEIVEGPPMVMPPGKSIFKCGAKVSSSDAPSACTRDF